MNDKSGPVVPKKTDLRLQISQDMANDKEAADGQISSLSYDLKLNNLK